jgi:hypothetical protein
MSNFLKPIVLGLGLVAGIAFGAHAQSVSGAPTPGPSVASLPLEGPRASSSNSIPAPVRPMVVPSGNYPGPAPGAGTGAMPPRFEKSADWDANPNMRPYTSGGTVKPH